VNTLWQSYSGMETGNSTVPPVVSNLRSKPYRAGARRFRVFTFFSLRSSYFLDSSTNIYLHAHTPSDPHIPISYEPGLALLPLPQNLRAEASNSLSPKSAEISPIDQYLHTSTTMESSDTYRFPKLKGSENYESWRIDATSALKAKGLWWVTSGKLGKPEIPQSNATTAAKKEYASAMNHWEDKNDRACGMIIFSTEQGPRVHIGKIEIATQMWATLKDQYEQSNLTTLHLAIKELIQSKQSDFKSILDYADSLKRAATRCSNAGEEVPVWIMGHLFLLGLNEVLEPYIFGLIQSAKTNKTKLSIDDMAIALVDHDKRSNQEEGSSSKSMVAKFGKKPKSRNNSKLRKGPAKTCFHCEQRGHNKQDCWYLNPKLRPEGWKPSQEKKDLAKEGSDKDLGKSSGVRIVRSMKVSFASV